MLLKCLTPFNRNRRKISKTGIYRQRRRWWDAWHTHAAPFDKTVCPHENSHWKFKHSRIFCLSMKVHEATSSFYPVLCFWRKSDVAQFALCLIPPSPPSTFHSVGELGRALTLCRQPEEKTVKILFRSLISKFVFGFFFWASQGPCLAPWGCRLSTWGMV
jgi:hypothetical protein